MWMLPLCPFPQLVLLVGQETPPEIFFFYQFQGFSFGSNASIFSLQRSKLSKIKRQVILWMFAESLKRSTSFARLRHSVTFKLSNSAAVDLTQNEDQDS